MGKPQKRKYGPYVSNALIFSDFIVVNLIYLLIVLINGSNEPVSTVRLVGLLVNVAYIPSAWSLRDFRDDRSQSMDRIALRSLEAVGIHALFFFSMLFFLSLEAWTWRFYAEFYGSMAVALTLWWMGSRVLLKSYRRRGRNYIRVLIVGTGPTARRLYRDMRADAGFGFRFMGFVDYGFAADFPYQDLYAGDLHRLRKIAEDLSIDQIYYTRSGEDEEALRLTLSVADDLMADFFYVPQVSRYLTRAFAMNAIGTVPIMTVRRNPLLSSWNRGVKRGFDILVSSIVLLLSPILFLPVAIAIKLSSPGPVFFRQMRTGYKGREFECLKFRTMKVNDESDSRQASRDDPRKTRLGDFLRRTSIDELPQFINVFRGEMSVVGPRPHMLAHTEQYSKLVDKYMVRHLIKPGITGWAQVNGFRGPTDQLWQMERRVENDVWYIENWSLLLDLKICARTVINAFHGEENAC